MRFRSFTALICRNFPAQDFNPRKSYVQSPRRCWREPSPGKVGYSTDFTNKSLTIFEVLSCAQEKGARVIFTLTIYRAPGRQFAPNPRHKSRHLCQRATTAQKVNSINTPTRKVSAIVISMLCSLNFSQAKKNALRAEEF